MEIKERAQLFQQCFEPVVGDYRNIEALSSQEGLELVDTTQDALDDVWKQGEFEPYREDRMKHLMEVIGNFHHSIRLIYDYLNNFDLFHKIKASDILSKDCGQTQSRASELFCDLWEDLVALLHLGVCRELLK